MLLRSWQLKLFFSCAEKENLQNQQQQKKTHAFHFWMNFFSFYFRFYSFASFNQSMIMYFVRVQQIITFIRFDWNIACWPDLGECYCFRMDFDEIWLMFYHPTWPRPSPMHFYDMVCCSCVQNGSRTFYGVELQWLFPALTKIWLQHYVLYRAVWLVHLTRNYLCYAQRYWYWIWVHCLIHGNNVKRFKFT